MGSTGAPPAAWQGPRLKEDQNSQTTDPPLPPTTPDLFTLMRGDAAGPSRSSINNRCQPTAIGAHAHSCTKRSNLRSSGRPKRRHGCASSRVPASRSPIFSATSRSSSTASFNRAVEGEKRSATTNRSRGSVAMTGTSGHDVEIGGHDGPKYARDIDEIGVRVDALETASRNQALAGRRSWWQS